MKISKFKMYHIILVVVFILALVFLKYDQSLYRNIFYIVLIISLIFICQIKLDKSSLST